MNVPGERGGAPSAPVVRPAFWDETSWHRWFRVGTAVVVLALWLTWAVSSWQQAPREVGIGQVGADIASGEVVAATLGRLDDSSTTGWRIDSATSRLTETDDGPILAYRLSSGEVRMIDTSTTDLGGENSAVALFDQLAGSSQLEVAFGFWDDRFIGLGWFAGLVVFLAIIGWAGGTRGTRWFWFWMLFAPVGIGIVAYAVFELLRPRAVITGRRPIERGLFGFGLAFLLIPLAISVLRAVVEGLLGPGVLPYDG